MTETPTRRRPGARAPGATQARTRALRVPEDEWGPLEQLAAERGVSTATIAREAFREYLANRQPGNT